VSVVRQIQNKGSRFVCCCCCLSSNKERRRKEQIEGCVFIVLVCVFEEEGECCVFQRVIERERENADYVCVDVCVDEHILLNKKRHIFFEISVRVRVIILGRELGKG